VTGHEHHLFWNGSDPLGSAIVVAGAIATVAAFAIAIRATLWPGERDPDHPKHRILRDDR
jgi:hypothetical protein